MKSCAMQWGIYCATLLLPGCSRMTHWVCCNAYQGKMIRINNLECARNYIRSIRIYNQFTTELLFTALWLSDEVMEVYKKLMVNKQGTISGEIPFKRNQVSFIILSNCGFNLSSNSKYMLYIESNNVLYKPIKIKEIPLSTELQIIFGKTYNYRTCYLVTFKKLDSNKAPLLHLRSNNEYNCISWKSLDHREFDKQCVYIGKERTRIL